LQEEGIMTFLSSVSIGQIPQSVEEFTALRDQLAETPQGGAAMMVVALLVYAEDEQLGQGCLAVAVEQGRLHEGRPGYGGWGLGARDLQLIGMQVGAQGHIPRSYVRGASPENGYELPDPPYEVEFGPNPHSGDPASGDYKVFVKSSGASSARPVRVRRDERGLWKAREWSSLLVGVKAPG
jgi:hypothetical protein